MTFPCAPWATIPDLCSPCSNLYDLDDALMDSFLAEASEILFQLSGQQFPGECTDTLRPCSRVRTNWRPGYSFLVSTSGPWPFCGCSETAPCGCNAIPEVDLGIYPLISVDEVKVDGAILSPALYRVDDRRFLVRNNDPDGTNPGWPICQDLNLPSSEAGTFEVSFTYGRNPPLSGVRAAAALACEFYRACTDDTNSCLLPWSAIQLVRQGVSLSLDPSLLLDVRPGHPPRMGIPLVDSFLRAFNPYGATAPGIVLSPDFERSGGRHWGT